MLEIPEEDYYIPPMPVPNDSTREEIQVSPRFFDVGGSNKDKQNNKPSFREVNLLKMENRLTR